MRNDSTRGPKPAPKLKAREPLAVEPPPELHLSEKAAAAYRGLAERLVAEGFSGMADARTVALAAQGIVLAERLQATAEATETLLTEDGKIHPILVELRAVRAQLQSLYGSLFMTPRARSACRVTEGQMREAAVSRIDTRQRTPAPPPAPAKRRGRAKKVSDGGGTNGDD